MKNDFILTKIQTDLFVTYIVLTPLLMAFRWFDYSFVITAFSLTEIFASIFGVVSIAQSLYMERSKIQDIKYKYKLEYYKEINNDTE